MSVRAAPLRSIMVLAVVAAGLVGCAGQGGGGVDYEAVALRSGEPVAIEDLRGEPAVLVSWATWCQECDEELTRLQDFAESRAADGVRVIAVNLDAASVEKEIDAKIERNGLTVELWRDRRNGFKRAFGALGVPTTVILDRDGEVISTHPGAIDFDDPAVRTALAEVDGGA